MAIHFKSEVQGDLLIVTTSGKDDGLDQVMAYGMAVIEKVREAKVAKVLCDERQLVYALDDISTFECAKFIAERASGLVRVAIVCGAAGSDSGGFWETVALNRGLCVCVTSDMERARAWVSEGK